MEYSPWNSPGQNTIVGSLFLLQDYFLYPLILSPLLLLPFFGRVAQHVGSQFPTRDWILALTVKAWHPRHRTTRGFMFPFFIYHILLSYSDFFPLLIFFYFGIPFFLSIVFSFFLSYLFDIFFPTYLAHYWTALLNPISHFLLVLMMYS